jgi:hypothetical protein
MSCHVTSACKALRVEPGASNYPRPHPVADTETVVIFLSFYSSSDTAPNILVLRMRLVRGRGHRLDPWRNGSPNQLRATGAPSAVLAYGVGLIPHLFVPFYSASVVFARATPALGVRRIGAAGLADETLAFWLCVSTTCERCASSSQ